VKGDINACGVARNIAIATTAVANNTDLTIAEISGVDVNRHSPRCTPNPMNMPRCFRTTNGSNLIAWSKHFSSLEEVGADGGF